MDQKSTVSLDSPERSLHVSLNHTRADGWHYKGSVSLRWTGDVDAEAELSRMCAQLHAIGESLVAKQRNISSPPKLTVRGHTGEDESPY
jgi:hypothetical protein